MNVESIGRDIYREACLDPFTDALAGAGFELVRRIFGPRSLAEGRLMTEGAIATLGERTIIAYRTGLSRPKANFVVAKMLGRIFRERRGLAQSSGAETELAAWLTAPSATFHEAVRELGLNIRALADEFAITQTSAALRAIEVEDLIGGAVAADDHVHKRGSMIWLHDDMVRRLAKGSPRHVRKVRVTDEPGRVALFSRGELARSA